MFEYHYIREGQPGSELFTFVVKAEELMSLARVERFNEVEKGVERKLNYSHVQQMVEFMRGSNASFAEPILGDLRGSWRLDQKRQTLHREGDAYLLVDDGQHRLASLHLLTSEERDRWEFKVTATLNTSYQERLRRFIQQLKRLKLDTHLVLQIQDRGDLFTDPISKLAYGIGKRLATEPGSPLRGLIFLEERASRRQPEGEDASKLEPLLGKIPPAQMLREQTLGIINISGIMRDLRQVASSPHSAIRALGQEQQFRVLVCIMNVAKEIWPQEWNDPRLYFLRRSPGIAAIFHLLLVGRNFKALLDKAFRNSVLTISPEAKDRVRQALGYAKGYDWSYRQFLKPEVLFPKPREIAQGLDSLIYKNAPQIELRRARDRFRRVKVASR